MNDDLNVVISIYQKGTLIKVAVEAPDGLNNFNDWEYFREDGISEKWNELLPDHAKGEILNIERIFDVVCL